MHSLNVQMNYFHFLQILSAVSYARFGNSILLWPLKHQHPVGSSGQDPELQLQQGRHFHPMHVLPCQSLPVRHCSASFHPMLFSSWKPRIIWFLFWCYPSALILGSYLKGLMILQWSHGTLTHGPRFSSRFHHQPPHCSRPVLLLSCLTTISKDTESPLLLGLSLGFTRFCDSFWYIQGCPPCNCSSPLPSVEMQVEVSENIGMWKVDTLKLCKHNKPCHGFLQNNPHHHPPHHTASHGHNLNPTICTLSPTWLLSLLYL